MSTNVNYNAIVSLTSHGNRLKNVLICVKPILLNLNNNVHVVLNIHIDDFCNIPVELFKYIETGKIELFVSAKNIGPHLKYFYTFLRYRNSPIILIDDDNIYPDDFITVLLQEHKKYPNDILCRRAELITLHNGILAEYRYWKRPFYLVEPSYELFMTGTGGILFPKKALLLDNTNITELLKYCKYDDDVYLNIIARRAHLKIRSINTKTIFKEELIDNITLQTALSNDKYRTDKVLRYYNDEFLTYLSDKFH